MKYTTKSVAQGVNILANDHYVAIPYDCTAVAAVDGVVKAGTVVPTNDAAAIGVLLNDVIVAENPNGAVVIHGFVNGAKLPAEVAEAAKTAMKQITVL